LYPIRKDKKGAAASECQKYRNNDIKTVNNLMGGVKFESYGKELAAIEGSRFNSQTWVWNSQTWV
jgi:hypothetical protein